MSAPAGEYEAEARRAEALARYHEKFAVAYGDDIAGDEHALVAKALRYLAHRIRAHPPGSGCECPANAAMNRYAPLIVEGAKAVAARWATVRDEPDATVKAALDVVAALKKPAKGGTDGDN